jgi:hypothetical protein
LRKSKSKSAYKKRLWKIFSRYIRLRDKATCITCGKRCELGEIHAGHYIPKSRGMSIYFNEKNVHAQCARCNLYLRGDLSNYALKLIDKYGVEVLGELEAERNKIKRFSEGEFLQLIEYYTKKVKELEDGN